MKFSEFYDMYVSGVPHEYFDLLKYCYCKNEWNEFCSESESKSKSNCGDLAIRVWNSAQKDPWLIAGYALVDLVEVLDLGY